MSILYRSDTHFFLTGGTALSRGYYNHRYSEDLDFFVNQSKTFDEQLEKVLAMLKESGFDWSTDIDFIRAENYATMKVRKDSEVSLKLDFVNDSVPMFGAIERTDLFYRTDSVKNILSNKLSAVFRYEAKDIADIREIALNESVDWTSAINEARQKDAGIELTYVSQVLSGMRQSDFEKIVWIKKIDWNDFQEDIKRIVFEMINS